MPLDGIVIYTFTSKAASDRPWRVQGFVLTETLSWPYILDIEADAPEELDFEALMGASCKFTMSRGQSSRCVHGIVESYDVVHQERQGNATLQMQIVPAVKTLQHQQDNRIFQDKSVPEIVSEVLEEGLAPYGREIELMLEDEYIKRGCCIQYCETNLDFIQRLLQEEGIGYFFDHRGDAEKMVLVDNNPGYQNHASAHVVEIPMASVPDATTEALSRLRYTQLTAATHVGIQGVDWTRPRDIFAHSHGDADSTGNSREIHLPAIGGYSGYAGEKYTEDTNKASARILTERHQMRQWEKMGGASNVTSLRPGSIFTVLEHNDRRFDQKKLLITHVVHLGHGSEPTTAADHASAYGNIFQCLPLDVPYRPDFPTLPHIVPGIQTATVVGPPGEDIWADEHGRVKVRFHWERHSTEDEKNSPWVRVVQGWAGVGYGNHFLPRVGMEVVVGFEHGVASLPIILGTAFNGINKTPYDVSESKTRSTIRSRSMPLGDEGYNELSFEDARGSEELYLRAERNWRAEVLKDKETRIDGDESHTVKGNRIRSVTGDENTSITGGRTETVEKDRLVMVDGNSRYTIKGERSIDVEKDMHLNVSGMTAAELLKDIRAVAGANMQLKVAEELTIQVDGSCVQKYGKALGQQADKIEVKVENGYTVRQGSTILSLDGDGKVTIKADKVIIKGTSVEIDADSFTVKANKTSLN